MKSLDGLKGLISPMEEREFFNNYFEEKPCIIRRGNRDYYRKLLTLKDIKSSVTEVKLGSYDLRVVKDCRLVPPDNYSSIAKIHNIEIRTGIKVEKLQALYKDGATLVFDGFQSICTPLRNLSHNLSEYLKCAVSVNVYLTPENSWGFPCHYDTHDVFILQVHGSKNWKVYDSPIELPLSNQSYQVDKDRLGDPIYEINLQQGDLFYMPRGYMHEGKANQEESAHITLGIYHTTWAKILLEHFAELASKVREVRTAFAADKFITSIEKEKLFSAIKSEVIASLTLESLEETFECHIKKNQNQIFE